MATPSADAHAGAGAAPEQALLRALRSRALRHLARREHSRAELRARLLLQLQAAQRRSEAQAAAAAAAATRAGTPSPPGQPVRRPADAANPAAPVDPGQWPALVDRLLDRLEQTGLLSDTRTAASVLRQQAARGGLRRIRQAMQAKGLDAALVAEAVEQARGSEFERAWALWQRRFGEPPPDARERARQMRFLAARGFEADTVRRVLRRAGDPQADDELG